MMNGLYAVALVVAALLVGVVLPMMQRKADEQAEDALADIFAGPPFDDLAIARLVRDSYDGLPYRGAWHPERDEWRSRATTS